MSTINPDGDWTETDETLMRMSLMLSFQRRVLDFGRECVKASGKHRDLPALEIATRDLHSCFSDVVELMFDFGRKADELRAKEMREHE